VATLDAVQDRISPSAIMMPSSEAYAPTLSRDVVGLLRRAARWLRVHGGLSSGLTRRTLRSVAHLALRAPVTEVFRRSMALPQGPCDSLDPLTGLPDRHKCAQLLQLHLRSAFRLGRYVSVLAVVLHDLRQLISVSGYSPADEVIRQAAQRIVRAVRGHADVGYLGSGTFIVVAVGDVLDEANLQARMRAEILEPFEAHDVTVAIEAVVGVARWPDHSDEAHELMRQASGAAEEARSSPYGVVVWNRTRDETAAADMRVARGLRTALRGSRSLQVWYQPQVALTTRRVVAFEALARWTDAEGALAATRVVQIAERAGLIWQLTYHVLDSALREVARWRRVLPHLSVSVNLSPLCLADEDLSRHVRRLLDYWDVPGDALTLEITESSLCTESAVAGRSTERLVEMGVALSIDDFGTGYSSFAHIKRFPGKELKVDRSFVAGMAANVTDRAIVAFAIDLARTTGRRAIAEGIEDSATEAALLAMGCEMGQGYFYGRPAPAEDVHKWISNHATVLDTAARPYPTALPTVLEAPGRDNVYSDRQLLRPSAPHTKVL
jgi:diguanylate cyclase (GGDEF)-like protein